MDFSARIFSRSTSVLLLLVLVIFLYANSLRGDFVWDDRALVTNNSFIHPVCQWKNILLTDLAAGSQKSFNFYRPLQNLSYCINYCLGGLNPVIFHGVSVAGHACVAIAGYFLLLALTGKQGVSLCASLIWAAHPVHTSVVAYISARADILCAFFLLVSWIAYIKTKSQTTVCWSLVCLGCYVLALLAKEHAIIFPVLLGAYHLTQPKTWQPKLFLGLLALTVFYLGWRLTVVYDVLFPLRYDVPLYLKIPGFFVAVVQYFKLLFFPQQLHMEYGNFLFTTGNTTFRLGLMLWLGLLGLFFWWRQRKPLVALGIGWFMVTLLPVSIFPINAYMAEGWLYFPSWGIWLATCCLVTEGLKNFRWESQVRNLSLVGYLLFLSYGTVVHNNYWHNALSLFEYTARFAGQSARVHFLLGQENLRLGRNSEAAENFRKVVRLDPSDHEAAAYLCQLGTCPVDQNHKEEK